MAKVDKASKASNAQKKIEIPVLRLLVARYKLWLIMDENDLQIQHRDRAYFSCVEIEERIRTLDAVITDIEEQIERAQNGKKTKK